MCDHERCRALRGGCELGYCSTTLSKIAEALPNAPVIPGIDELMDTEITIVGERLAPSASLLR